MFRHNTLLGVEISLYRSLVLKASWSTLVILTGTSQTCFVMKQDWITNTFTVLLKFQCRPSSSAALMLHCLLLLLHYSYSMLPGRKYCFLTLKVIVAPSDAQWEGMGDAGLARYEPALLLPCPTLRILSYSNY